MSKILDSLLLKDTKTGEATEYQIQDSQLKARVDNLIANAGNTDDNAELIDIRVGEDGTQYPTAGEAVRGQVSKLKGEIADATTKGGNILTTLTAEPKIISTYKNSIVFYDNDSYSTFLVPIVAGKKYYLAAKTESVPGVRQAFVNSDRVGSADTYVSAEIIPGSPTEITASENGYFVISVLSSSANGLSVSEGSVDTEDFYNQFSGKFLFSDRQLNQGMAYTVSNAFESKVAGKKLFAIGDSITFGYTVTGKNPDGSLIGGRVTKKWWEFVAERYGMTATANAEIGRAFTKDGSMSTRFTQKVKEIPSDTDVIIVFGGTNDFNWSPTIGSMDDESSEANGGISFCSAFKYVAEYLSSNFQDKIIIFMTPLPRCDPSFDTKDRNGKRLSAYADTIKEMCRYYGFHCIDLNRVGGFHVYSESWLASNMVDGLHPNDAGTELYVRNGIFPVLDKIFKPLKIN